MNQSFTPDPEDLRDPNARVIAPVIISTRAAEGVMEDTSAKIIEEYGTQAGFIVRPPVVIPDGEAVLAVLTELLTQVEPAVIITSGGTGLTPDDQTPEFTVPLLDKEIPGIMEAIRACGREKTPHAALSRGVAGVAGNTVVVNLPGSPNGVKDGMEVLVGVLAHLCNQVANVRTNHAAPQSANSPRISPRNFEIAPGSNAEAAYSEEAGVVIHASVSSETLQRSRAEAEVGSELHGAVVSFAGVVRNHDGGQDVEKLSYSHHPSAEQKVQELAQKVAERNPGTRLWVSHRVGELAIGDDALVAAASSPHRAEAFTACQDLVETIKYELPIWKEQFLTDGNVQWVGIGEDK